MAKKQIKQTTKDFLLENQNKRSPEDMAERAGLDPEKVVKKLEVLNSLPKKNDEWISQLKQTSTWKQLQSQFSKDELNFFLDKYVITMEQFKDDVFATELTQIIQMIKFEILMDRNLRDRRKNRESIENLESLESDLMDEVGGDLTQMTESQHTRYIEIQKTCGLMRAGEKASTTEYNDLHKEHSTLMKLLKGTREQRMKNSIDVTTTFFDFVKSLMNKDKQEKEARQLELFKIAANKEYENLTKPHTYLNGEADLPILSAESMERYEKSKIEESTNAE